MLEYQCWDNDPKPGLNYYRLKQTDFDGKFSYSEVRSVDFFGAGEVLIYPNPTSNMFSFQTNELNVEVIIYDVQGKLLMKNKFIDLSLIEVDLSHLDKGIYHVHIVYPQKTIIREVVKL